MFNVGDTVYEKDKNRPWVIEEIDLFANPIPKYKLVQGEWSFWDYCVGWKKLVLPDEALKYGEILTDDMFYVSKPTGDLDIRIRIILYDNCLYYFKMINGDIIKFKELMKK